MANDNEPYTLLPFQFKRYDPETFLLANICGDHIFLQYDDFSEFIGLQLCPSAPIFKDLKSRHFLAEQDLPLAVELMANKYRTRKGFLRHFTCLHMLVVTLRCNQDCEYCQVSAESDQAFQFDMAPETAVHIVERIFEGPSDNIKIEFQGGEPTLNWSAVTAAVKHAEKLNKKVGKHLEFVICTNLTGINRAKLEFLRDHKVSISTSLDGPTDIHNKYRILRNGQNTYQAFTQNLAMAREICGPDCASALMTTSAANVSKIKSVIEEYVNMGFKGIFLRSLNPYGMAAQNKAYLGYTVEEWLTAYRNALDHIVHLNLDGIFFPEFFTTLLLTRILTPFSTGFVDLQSPAGAGIAGAIYDFNGDVYPADEARMLARMGDNQFWLGNVFESDFRTIFNGRKLREIVAQSNVETLPSCASCVYQAYCGADPVRNYLETGSVIGRRPDSDFCRKHMGVFEILFEKLRVNDEDEMKVFWSWITRKSLRQTRGESA
jgi:His-Xaa-Ser system radical SAM maturase HxsB